MKKVKNSLHLRPSRMPSGGQVSAWVALLAFALLTGAALVGGKQGQPSLAPTDATALSAEDLGRYAMIDRAQEAGEFGKADRLIDQLHNRGLVGYALAERYTRGHYAASREELSAWLAQYGDQPQAPHIARIAALRGVKVTLPKTVEPLKGDGTGNNLGRSAMPDRWYDAISHWRAGEISAAAEIFTTLAAEGSLNDWQQAAAEYWAARAEAKLGHDLRAHEHWMRAAEAPATFYGMLAAARLGHALPAVKAPKVSEALRRNPRAIRASLLVQTGRKEEAETELRVLYGALTETKRPGLVTLAGELELSNLQLRLSRMPGLTPAEALFARFPTPRYIAALDPIMDAALVTAVARNESAFQEEARNHGSGAMGMMQMLPSTARTVERRVGETLLREASALDHSDTLAARLGNPALSARYGAEYLRMLANEPVIQHNLIYLLIGYNAGSGTLAGWKSMAHEISDPLLFIESIPYAETRNYVMQVLAYYWVYQTAMGEHPASLEAINNEQWPMLERPGGKG